MTHFAYHVFLSGVEYAALWTCSIFRSYLGTVRVRAYEM